MSRRRPRSPYFQEFLDQRAEAREAFELVRESQYQRAEEACRGALLNRRGKVERIDSYSLFMGTRARAYAYASPELVEWWESNPRVTFEEFERQHFHSR